MKIAIVGVDGYIGSFLYERLHRHDVHGFNRTHVLSKNELYQYDVVIYLGGLTGRLKCAQHTKQKLWDENVGDILNIGRMMTSSQVLIYASSASLLEGYMDVAVDENVEIQNELLDEYSISMKEREIQIQTLPITTIGFRFGTIIGISPKQRKDLVYFEMIKSAFLTNCITVKNPNCCRAILWLNDVERIFEVVLNNLNIVKHRHSIYHVSSFNMTIHEIASSIAQRLNVKIQIETDQGKSGFFLSTLKFQETFDFQFKGTPELIMDELIENIGYLCLENAFVQDECRVCKGKDVMIVLDLGKQPLANNYVLKPMKQMEYPLCLIRCNDCFHGQLNYTIPPEVMFKEYQYKSGTSTTIKKYFEFVVEKCIQDANISNGGVVLEIACNDGSQLDEFKNRGWKTIGVDPARNLIGIGIEKGHEIYEGFWGVDEFSEIDIPNIIIAQNVFAHVPDPIVFLQACKEKMDEKTLLYIQTSQCNMYETGEFDTIYHEHFSFFTLRSMLKATEMCGLIVSEFTKQPIHGESFLFQIRRGEKHFQNVLDIYQQEIDNGYYTNEYYIKYPSRVLGVKEWVGNVLDVFSNRVLIGYGAAAKGMTLLNFFNIKNMEYIVDESPLKQGKYTPRTNILIESIEKMKEDKREMVIFVLAWNFFQEIIEKISIHRKGRLTYIIQPYPKQCVYVLKKDDTIKPIFYG